MTVSPTRDEFVALAADHGVVPVWRELLADLETPLSVYARLRGDGSWGGANQLRAGCVAGEAIRWRGRGMRATSRPVCSSSCKSRSQGGRCGG